MNRNILHTPEGVRDIYGEEYSRKLKVEELIHSKFRMFGYKDIQTPSFEFFDVFSKEIGTTPSKDLYKFFDKEGNTLVLRPDFTPSMARCAAKYFMEEEFPIRFCYLGNTFSNTSSLQGKLTEVTQMGAELINDGSIEAEAEIIAMLVQSLKATGLEDFQVSIGQVDYFKGICEASNIEEETAMILRENISGKNFFAVEELLVQHNVSEDYHQAFLKIGELFGAVDVLSAAKELVDNERSLNAVKQLEELYKLLQIYGVSDYISFDFGMLSKYHYYTGVIFQAYTYGVGEPIAKGGRYNNLLGKFGKDAPAIGFVVVVDDLLNALHSQKISIDLAVDNALIVYDKLSFKKALEKAIDLREKGIYVELMQMTDTNSADKYMSYARQNRFCNIYFVYED